ncbi:hypothetical protein WI47_26945 [Burkholderia cepacia]|nr:hypothetical protein WI47_26945 [Burkholderia cepacia]
MICCTWKRGRVTHEIELNHHRRRSVIIALDFGANTRAHVAHPHIVKSPDVVQFIDSLLRADDACLSVNVLDNVSAHHDIDETTRERWMLDH